MSQRITGFHGILIVASLLLVGSNLAFAAGVKDSKGVVDPKKCSAVGQPTCELSAAKYLGKVKMKKPHSKAFFDPRKGGEWWAIAR